ncbi:MAG: hypothetical protein AB7W37_17515 [Syntrophobacteraceae bacterium]
MYNELGAYIFKVRQIHKIGGEFWSSMKAMIDVMHREAMNDRDAKSTPMRRVRSVK